MEHTLQYQKKGNPAVVSEKDSTYILLDNNKLLELNQTGTLIWKALNRPQSITRLVTHISEIYPVSSQKKSILIHDIQSFLNILLEHKLIIKKTGK